MRYLVVALAALLAAGVSACSESGPEPIPPNCDAMPNSMAFGNQLVPPEGEDPVVLTGPFMILNRVFVQSEIRDNADLRGQISLHFDSARSGSPLLQLAPSGADPSFLIAPNDTAFYGLSVVIDRNTTEGSYTGYVELGTGCEQIPFSLDVTQRIGNQPDYQVYWGGIRGAGDGEYEYPLNLAMDDDGRIFMVDQESQTIQRFDTDGYVTNEIWRLRTEVGAVVPGTEFSRPYGIAVDGNGNVHLGDYGKSRMFMFDRRGVHIKTWGYNRDGTGMFNEPWALAVDDENHVYILDRRSRRVSRYDVYSTLTQELLGHWGPPLGQPGYLGFPWDIAIHGEHVFITDYQNNCVHKFTLEGQFLLSWGTGGELHGQFDRPTGIDVDAQGNVYVVDSENGRVQQFDAEGHFLNMWGEWGRGIGGQFNEPNDIMVGSDGRIYVVDSGNQRIQVFAYD